MFYSKCGIWFNFITEIPWNLMEFNSTVFTVEYFSGLENSVGIIKL